MADKNKVEDMYEMDWHNVFFEEKSISSTLWQEIIEGVSMGIRYFTIRYVTVFNLTVNILLKNFFALNITIMLFIHTLR